MIGKRSSTISNTAIRTSCFMALSSKGTAFEGYLGESNCAVFAKSAEQNPPTASLAKGSDVDDHSFVAIDGEPHVITRPEALQQCRGSDHEAHFHHACHEPLDLLVGDNQPAFARLNGDDDADALEKTIYRGSLVGGQRRLLLTTCLTSAPLG